MLVYTGADSGLDLDHVCADCCLSVSGVSWFAYTCSVLADSKGRRFRAAPVSDMCRQVFSAGRWYNYCRLYYMLPGGWFIPVQIVV